MTSSRRLGRVLSAAACVALLAMPGSASAQTGGRSNDLPVVSDSRLAEDLILGRSAALRVLEQPSGENYLPPTRSNVDLVSRLELRHPDGAVTADEIADVGVLKNTAYLAGWSQGIFNEPCERGGVYSVDISNPAEPRQLAFRPALAQNYHGEGVHAISVKTPEFEGDLLAVNNETCTETTTPPNQNVEEGGGFDLYNVSDPANPQLLSRANGDYGPEGSLVAPTGSDGIANEAHSIFLWQDGDKAYAVLVDNEEEHDVDIFDVSNPRNVQPVGEFDLDERFPQIEEDEVGQGNFATNNSHDMIVKEIGGVQTMLMSYWDAGYVTLNVDNPADPRYIGDTDFDATDPLTGFSPPEGNGHQAEFSHDNRHILAADEDFDQYRFQAEITDGPNEGFTFQEAGGADAGGQLAPGAPLSGDTRFVGVGCDPLPPATADVSVAVFERGVCSFQIKVENADAAGYDSAIIFNNRDGANARCEGLLGMTLGTYTGDVTALFVARSVGFRIIDAYDEGTYTCDPDAGTGTPAPAAPKEGSPVQIAVLFDGWGYAHQYRNGEGKLPKVDDYAIQEGVDDRWATRFGDLSIHEFAADPETNLAYISYYSGGLRVVRFGDGGIEEVGRFIDQRPDGKGNDFWGVEQFTTAQGERLIATSDRDYGLYIFRYTGPGAVKPAPAAGGSQAPAALKATGCENQILGTAASDLLAGTDGSDSVRAAAGDDVIDARAGDDCLFGDAGKDVIDGEDGNDRLEGGAGDDRLIGGAGNDDQFGGAGVDRLNGEDGADLLSGGAKRDIISGGRGADALYGSTGNDTITGGSGRDRISGGSGADRIYGNAGGDRITPGRGQDRVIAAGGNDRISARDGRRDRISCGSGRDQVSADRNDVLTSCERVSRR